jgi:hypothetical protein
VVSISCLVCVLINSIVEGIILNPISGKWRCGRSIGTCTNGMRDELAMRTPLDFETDHAKDSIKVWSSLPANYSCPENDYYDLYSNNSCVNEWDFTESLSSPKDAFRETCEFYGGPYLRREWLSSTNEFPNSQDSTSQRKKMSLSRGPISRSKSLHNFQKSNNQMSESKEETITIGLSEQDLDRARSVIGLPTKGFFNDCLCPSIYRGLSRNIRGNYVNTSGSQISSRPFPSDLDLGYGSHSASWTESMNVSYDCNIKHKKQIFIKSSLAFAL